MDKGYFGNLKIKAVIEISVPSKQHGNYRTSNSVGLFAFIGVINEATLFKQVHYVILYGAIIAFLDSGEQLS